MKNDLVQLEEVECGTFFMPYKISTYTLTPTEEKNITCLTSSHEGKRDKKPWVFMVKGSPGEISKKLGIPITEVK